MTYNTAYASSGNTYCCAIIANVNTYIRKCLLVSDVEDVANQGQQIMLDAFDDFEYSLLSDYDSTYSADS
jgi:hypothetical protein